MMILNRIKGLLFELIDRRLSTQLNRFGFARRTMKNKLFYEESVETDVRRCLLDYYEFSGGLHIDERAVNMYNKVCKTKLFDVRFIPDDVYYCYIEPYYNNVIAAKSLDDKNYYDLLFPDVDQPVTIGRIINGVSCDANYNHISFDELIYRCQQQPEIIVKPSVDSEGGHGISLWKSNNMNDTFRAMLKTRDNVVIQQLISQHSTVAAVHKSSINTIRIMTFIHADDVEVLSTILRFGIGESRVDNASSGGWFCGVDDDGKLKKYAYDVKGNCYERHPDGLTFEGHQIKGVKACKETAKRLAVRISRTCKLASWDFAVGEDGNPVFIEVNMTYGQLDFHQMTNGPLFKDLTPNVMQEVFSSRKKRIVQKLIRI